MHFPSKPFRPRPESRLCVHIYEYFYNNNPPLTRWPFVKSHRPLAPAVAPSTTTYSFAADKRYSIRISDWHFYLSYIAIKRAKERCWLSFCSSKLYGRTLHFFSHETYRKKKRSKISAKCFNFYLKTKLPFSGEGQKPLYSQLWKGITAIESAETQCTSKTKIHNLQLYRPIQYAHD